MVTIPMVKHLIASSRPRNGLRGSRLILLGLSVLMGAFLADSHLLGLHSPWNWLLPQLLLVAIILVFAYGVSQNRKLSRLMLQAFESTQLHCWEDAEPLLRRLLTMPLRHPQARVELLMALAATAEAQQQFDAAQCIYERVLQEKRGDPIQLHAARVAIAGTMLRTGQLTDAVRLIDRLVRADLPEALRAQVELLALQREVMMGQTQDNLASAEERRRLFRDHLSTRAGFGYALLAAAFDRAQQADSASRFWHDATLLIKPEDLVNRFGELAPLVGKYARAEVAI